MRDRVVKNDISRHLPGRKGVFFRRAVLRCVVCWVFKNLSATTDPGLVRMGDHAGIDLPAVAAVIAAEIKHAPTCY